MDSSRKFFSTVISSVLPEITPETMNYLLQITTIKELKPRDYFIEITKPHREIGFIAKGLVRGYYMNEKGVEITTRLLKEGGFATHYKAFLNQEPSKYAFQCLEETTFVCFDFDHIQKGYALYPDLERFGRLIAENIIKILESRTESFQFMEAEERYLEFLKSNPDLFNRISLNTLSSYLGITRPSLSRIRNNIAK